MQSLPWHQFFCWLRTLLSRFSVVCTETIHSIHILCKGEPELQGDGGWWYRELYSKEVIRRNPKKNTFYRRYREREKEKETEKRGGGVGIGDMVKTECACVLFRSAQLSVAPTAKRLGIFFVLVVCLFFLSFFKNNFLSVSFWKSGRFIVLLDWIKEELRRALSSIWTFILQPPIENIFLHS